MFLHEPGSVPLWKRSEPMNGVAPSLSSLCKHPDYSKSLYKFVFGGAGSLFLHVVFLQWRAVQSCREQTTSIQTTLSLRPVAFSSWWLLLLRSAGTRSCVTWPSLFQDMWNLWTGDQTCVPCIGRWILSHCTTREVPKVSLKINWKPSTLFLLVLWAAIYGVAQSQKLLSSSSSSSSKLV